MNTPGHNVRNPTSTRLLLFFCRHRVPLLSKLYRLLHHCDIYCDLKGCNVLMPHPYGIIIHSRTVIGQGVTIMQQVTLGGGRPGVNAAPIIEDDVYIGAGAKVLGNVRIGRHAVIGANSVITRDVAAGATVVGANRIVSTSAASNP
ncbi:serine acetyltransferase [mine drainage metagenome]|uniref:Serine acetyltransferase n=1 Tax=mine drainage metagenome TaxID=410659 RepID=A0A1J5P1R6_9ZZZZ